MSPQLRASSEKVFGGRVRINSRRRQFPVLLMVVDALRRNRKYFPASQSRIMSLCPRRADRVLFGRCSLPGTVEGVEGRNG